MGDEVQAIKSGILEIADLFVINKSDQPGADRVQQELEANGWTTPILKTVATSGEGIDRLLEEVERVPVRPRKVAARSLTLRVTNLNRAVEALQSAGILVVDPPAGEMLELIEEP
jgi:LAO/AO transport system kinase